MSVWNLHLVIFTHCWSRHLHSLFTMTWPCHLSTDASEENGGMNGYLESTKATCVQQSKNAVLWVFLHACKCFFFLISCLTNSRFYFAVSFLWLHKRCKAQDKVRAVKIYSCNLNWNTILCERRIKMKRFFPSSSSSGLVLCPAWHLQKSQKERKWTLMWVHLRTDQSYTCKLSFFSRQIVG